MIIRPAKLSDLPAITEIYAECVVNGIATYELSAPDLREMTSRFQTITANNYPYLVAESDGQIIGYAYASAFRTRPAYNWSCEDSIYLSPAGRGQGTGSLLLSRLIECCTALGFRQMIAVIGGAHPASIGVHEKAGFHHSGRIEATGYKHGRWLDTVFMELALGEGSTTHPNINAYPGPLHQ